MNFKLLFTISLLIIFHRQLIAQTTERKAGFSYEFNFGTFNDEYYRFVNNLSYYQSLNSKLQIAFRVGRARLSRTGKLSELEKMNVFLRREVQTLAGGSFRYYLFNNKFSPSLEARGGISFGKKTKKINPLFGLLAGYTFRINNVTSISLGYNIEYTKYFASTYYTDGVGETVYRVDNFNPIGKITHNTFINFIF